MAGDEMAEVIRYEEVYISYRDVPVVRNLSFALEEGAILGIVGESGSGKSTLIKAPMGLLGREGEVTGGRILFGNVNLPELKEEEVRKYCGSKIGMVFQNAGASFHPIRTIREQLYEAVREHEAVSLAEFEERAEEILRKFSFDDTKRILDAYPFELSGGMQQRVALASAMLLKPRLLMADEPTSALDVTVQKQVMEEMLLAREEMGTSILLVTHNIGLVRRMADKVLVLKDGECVEYGRTEDILNHPQAEYTRKLLDSVPRLRRKGQD